MSIMASSLTLFAGGNKFGERRPSTTTTTSHPVVVAAVAVVHLNHAGASPCAEAVVHRITEQLQLARTGGIRGGRSGAGRVAIRLPQDCGHASRS